MTDEKLLIGDQLKVNCLIKTPQKQTNFYLFDYQKYLLSKKIQKICYPDKITKVKTTNNILLLSKRFIIKQIEKRKNKAYYKMFLLGSKEDIEEKIKTSFVQNGISHLFALSGMHLSFLIMILTRIFKKNKTIIAFLIIYFLLSNFSYSLLRSLVLYIFITYKNKLNIPIKNYQFLFIMALIIWLDNPYCIYDLGFDFSFIITFFLLRFSKILKGKNIISTTLKISIFCFLIGLPLSININFSINFLTPILNMFFVPFITYLFLPTIFITFFIPGLEPILTLLVNILEVMTIKISTLKSLNLTFCHISMVVLVIYYGLLYLFFKYHTKKKIILLIIILIIHYMYPSFKKGIYLDVLDVGQGDSLLLSLNNNYILIDTGGMYGNDNITKNILLPSLKSRGIKKLDYLIISHGDYDHMKEAVNLVNEFKVDKVILNRGSYNKLEQDLIKTLNIKKIKFYQNLKKISIGKNQLQFLNTKLYDNENDNSNVIYFNYHNYKFLFMGDAEYDKEMDIISKYKLSNIDFLKVGHHGSDTSSNIEFINTINPKYSLLSVGKNNRYGHPKKETLKNLSKSKIYRTDKNGSIEVRVNKYGYKIKTCL